MNNHTEEETIVNSLTPLPGKTGKHVNALVSLHALVHLRKHKKSWSPGYFPDWEITSWVRKTQQLTPGGHKAILTGHAAPREAMPQHLVIPGEG